MHRPLLVLILAATVMSAPPPVFAANASMDEEIDFLLTSVAESSCVFIRNGKEYTGAAARDHLQMKRERGGKYFETTEQFIERLASKSSWSGKPYRIRCGETEEDAGDWFNRVLQTYRSRETA
jgi:Family of unknown function (DUF5329)